jgi:hypothetical protein
MVKPNFHQTANAFHFVYSKKGYTGKKKNAPD